MRNGGVYAAGVASHVFQLRVLSVCSATGVKTFAYIASGVSGFAFSSSLINSFM